MAERSDIVHLLRRTEFVDRRERVAELVPLTIEQAVDNILAVPGGPGSVTFVHPDNWRRGEELIHFWLDRMAHDSPRPIQEKMGFFWHGHFCSEFSKVDSPDRMREQIDLFRTNSLGNLRHIAKTMSRQVAMLRYLDNNQNKNTSPNQNFARELMELFILGVGNYTEADVEAATAAWTGHTDDWETHGYVWRDDWHDYSAKQFLGRTINAAGAGPDHGDHTIDVMLGGTALGDGIVPGGGPNAGRPARDVAAEFISRKLWIEFAGTNPSAAVLGALRDVALANDFEILPWVRALLLRPEFYTAEVKEGLVRSPVEFVVAALVATGHRSADATPLWLAEGMGQKPLYPPNVAGWKHNGYWVNASAIAKRIQTCRSFMWRSLDGYWSGTDPIRLGRGTIARDEVNSPTSTGRHILDRMLDLMDLEFSTATYDALLAYDDPDRTWRRPDWISLILMAPDMHVA